MAIGLPGLRVPGPRDCSAPPSAGSCSPQSEDCLAALRCLIVLASYARQWVVDRHSDQVRCGQSLQEMVLLVLLAGTVASHWRCAPELSGLDHPLKSV